MKKFVPVLFAALLSCSAAFAAETELPTEASQPTQTEQVQVEKVESPEAPAVDFGAPQLSFVNVCADPIDDQCNTDDDFFECRSTCWDEYSHCMNLCQPPDFDGHGTLTACKASCTEDKSSCMAGC